MLEQLLGARLASLTGHERVWFRFLEAPEPGVPPLLLTSWVDDRRGTLLRGTRALHRSRPGGRALQGMGWVTGDGWIDLHHPELTPDHLEAVARWLRDLPSPDPGLRALAGLRVVVDGTPTAHPALRSLSSLPARAGTPGGAARALAALPSGAQARIWACGRSLVVVPAEGDEGGETFEGMVVGAVLAGASGPTGQGVVARVGGGGLVLAFPDPEDGSADAVADVVAALAPDHPALWELTTAPRLTLNEAFDSGLLATDRADRSTSATRAGAVAKAGVAAWFWFTLADRDGAPRLLLEKNEAALASAARKVAGEGATARGRIKWADGAPQLRADATFPGFADHLRAFGRAQGRRWPDLATFATARVHTPEATR